MDPYQSPKNKPLKVELDRVRIRRGQLGEYTVEVKDKDGKWIFWNSTNDSTWIIMLLAEQVQKLQSFKDYVHGRLDDADVPINPDPAGNATHGCRIEGRLDYALGTKR